MDQRSQRRTEPLEFRRLSAEEQQATVETFCASMQRRRTVRDFSNEPVPFHLIEAAVRTAASAPSGANQQPWKFVVVSDPEVKRKIRIAAEDEEREFYERRAPQEWLDALAPLGTDWRKPFLETAPYLIVVFRIDYGISKDSDGNEQKYKHYYVSESVGIAVGMLLSAVHLAGLVALTHTPSPMAFLSELLHRPKNERAFMLIPVGFPAEGAMVPAIRRKTLNEVIEAIGIPARAETGIAREDSTFYY
jgi:iodotyrosine deiodinase